MLVAIAALVEYQRQARPRMAGQPECSCWGNVLADTEGNPFCIVDLGHEAA